MFNYCLLGALKKHSIFAIFLKYKNLIFRGPAPTHPLDPPLDFWARPPSQISDHVQVWRCIWFFLTKLHLFFRRRHLVNERNREELDEVSNRRLTSMALDVSRGLSYLAELKYVHRDVACRNCLVNSTRVVKLADFGMTRPMYENDYYR